MKSKLYMPILLAAAFAAVSPFLFSQQQANVIEIPGIDIESQLEWFTTNAASNTSYLIRLSDDVTIPPQTFILPRVRNVTLTIYGETPGQTIIPAEAGNLFLVGFGVTLILNGAITLSGFDGNDNELVHVNSGGTFIMNDTVTLSGNHGGGVANWGEFTMHGGTISGNSGALGAAGGVRNWGRFTMYGGEISANSGGDGTEVLIGGSGGVFNAGTFTMHSGVISGNSGGAGGGEDGSNRWGISGGTGGVNSSGTFIMHGGVISGNSGGQGYEGLWGGIGGVSNAGRFTMYGGEIANNTHGGLGPGIDGSLWYGWEGISGVFTSGIFTLRGGQISGTGAGGSVGVWSFRGGVPTAYGVFRITDGIVHGLYAQEAALNASGALRIVGQVTTAHFGRFNNAGFFVSLGNLGDTDNTIHVEDGVLQ